MARALRWPAVAVVTCVVGLWCASGASAAPVVAHWGMNETSGTTSFDDSGNGINGTLTNVTLGLPGASGTAYGFDGRTSKMVVPKVAILAPGAQPVTVSMKVQTTHRPGTGNFDFDMWSKGGYQVEIYPRNGLAQARCKFKSASTKVVIQAGPDLIDGRWHTIACHKDDAGTSLIVDGTWFTHPGNIGALKPGSTTYIGVGSDGNDHYFGQLDDVTVEIG